MKKKKQDKKIEIISVILPLITIMIMFVTLRVQPTGLAYETGSLYTLNGSISINIRTIPADSYISIKVDDYIMKVTIVEFLKMSGKSYKIKNGYVIAEGIYSVDFTSLGITQSFEKGRHTIITEAIYKGEVVQRNEQKVQI